jgi:hypothetical protein
MAKLSHYDISLAHHMPCSLSITSLRTIESKLALLELGRRLISVIHRVDIGCNMSGSASAAAHFDCASEVSVASGYGERATARLRQLLQ